MNVGSYGSPGNRVFLRLVRLAGVSTNHPGPPFFLHNSARSLTRKAQGFSGRGVQKKKKFSTSKWCKADPRAGNGAGKDILEKKKGLDCYIQTLDFFGGMRGAKQ